MLRVLIASNYAHTRDALQGTLEAEGFVMVGEARCDTGALSVIQQTRPDVVLIDANMSHLDGLGWLEEVKNRAPDVTAVVVAPASTPPSALAAAIKGGADGWILKPDLLHQLGSEIAHALRAASFGVFRAAPDCVGAYSAV